MYSTGLIFHWFINGVDYTPYIVPNRALLQNLQANKDKPLTFTCSISDSAAMNRVSPVSDPATAPTPDPSCVDNWGSVTCGQWAASGYCTNPLTQPTMAIACRRSCAFC